MNRKKVFCRFQRNIHRCRKYKCIQILSGNPAIIRGCGRTGGCVHRQDVHFPDQMGKNMPCMDNRTRRNHRKIQFLLQKGRCIRRNTIQQRETPETAEKGFCPSADQRTTPGTQYRNGPVYDFLRCLPGNYRKIRRITGRKGTAERREGAAATVRCARYADRGAEIHNRLVIVTGTGSWHKESGVRFKLLPDGWLQNAFPDAQNPGINPENIPVHSGNRNLISYGSNRPCGIRTDTADFPEMRRIGRKNPPILFHNLPGSFQKVSGTGIVSKAFPHFQHFRFISGGKIRQGRKTGQESLIIRNYRIHTCLLEHNFADPGSVRILNPTPGHLPGISVIPFKQGIRKLSVTFHLDASLLTE